MEVTTIDSGKFLYVGRTGDSSSLKAGSPYTRMTQHLGHGVTTNQVRRYLEKQGLKVEDCRYRFVAHGPILEESLSGSREDHDLRRDIVASMEKALADHLTKAGYKLLNEVRSLKPLDASLFEPVRATFANEFPLLDADD